MYFIGAAEGPVKIGWTKEEARCRLRSLQTGNWNKLEVFGVIKCPKSFEAATHERLKHCRIRGEWFDRDEALEELDDLRLQITLLGCVAEMGHRYPWREEPAIDHEAALREVDEAFANWQPRGRQ